MNFTKGALMGMIAGAIVGAMNSDNIRTMMNRGQKKMKRARRRYGI